MDVLDAVFRKPFEVMQFWASDRFVTHEMTGYGFLARLHSESDRPGMWLFDLMHLESKNWLGDYVHPFLPSRSNLAALHTGCARGCELLARMNRDSNFTVPKGRLINGLEPYKDSGIRNLLDDRYQTLLRFTLLSDWGITTPSPDQFGRQPIVFHFQPGLPCAAALVRGMQPILEALAGDLTVTKQSLEARGERKFDVLEYRTESGDTFRQEFDVTAYFGKPLKNETFDFTVNADPPSDPALPSLDEDVEQAKSYIDMWITCHDSGTDFFLLADQLYFAETDELLPRDAPLHVLTFCDLMQFARKRIILSDEQLRELVEYADAKGVDVRQAPRIVLRHRALHKKWWQFWK
jgi:hypothetical protein